MPPPRNVLSDACFPHSMGSTPAGQKRSRLLQNSIVAQLLCRARPPARLSEENPAWYRPQKPRLTRRRVCKFGSPEVRKSSGWAVNPSGQRTTLRASALVDTSTLPTLRASTLPTITTLRATTLPTLRASELVCHDRFLLPSTGPIRREENRAVSALAALSPSYSLALSLRSA